MPKYDGVMTHLLCLTPLPMEMKSGEWGGNACLPVGRLFGLLRSIALVDRSFLPVAFATLTFFFAPRVFFFNIRLQNFRPHGWRLLTNNAGFELNDLTCIPLSEIRYFRYFKKPSDRAASISVTFLSWFGANPLHGRFLFKGTRKHRSV